MSKSLPRKAIIAISSFNGAIYPGGQKQAFFSRRLCIHLRF